jgi:hypothetical protein
LQLDFNIHNNFILLPNTVSFFPQFSFWLNILTETFNYKIIINKNWLLVKALFKKDHVFITFSVKCTNWKNNMGLLILEHILHLDDINRYN